MEKLSKLDLYRVKPVSIIGKLFALLPYKRKQGFFVSEPYYAVKTLSWKKVYELSISENIDNYGKDIFRVEKTLYRIFLEIEYEKARKEGIRPDTVIENFKQEKYFTVVGDSIVYADFALSLIE
jgi:hypothetical protein